ncbi:hypothetical protein AB0M95_20450 [Sphaerisporangium sp. NPDC051017]
MSVDLHHCAVVADDPLTEDDLVEILGRDALRPFRAEPGRSR